MIPSLHGNRLLEFLTSLSFPYPPTSLIPPFFSSSALFVWLVVGFKTENRSLHAIHRKTLTGKPPPTCLLAAFLRIGCTGRFSMAGRPELWQGAKMKG